MIKRALLAFGFAGLIATSASAMEFGVRAPEGRLNPQGAVVILGGEIKAGDFDRFKKVLAQVRREGKTVVALEMNSWGGDADTGLLFADWVYRHPPVGVTVRTQCLSACSYAAMVALGRHRLVLLGSAQIGVHQVHDTATGVPDPAWTEQASRTLAGYQAPQEILDEMVQTPATSMTSYDAGQLTARGLAVYNPG